MKAQTMYVSIIIAVAFVVVAKDRSYHMTEGESLLYLWKYWVLAGIFFGISWLLSKHKRPTTMKGADMELVDTIYELQHFRVVASVWRRGSLEECRKEREELRKELKMFRPEEWRIVRLETHLVTIRGLPMETNTDSNERKGSEMSAERGETPRLSVDTHSTIN